MKRLCKLISDYMGVLVLLAAVAALLWPEVFSRIKPTVINPLLGVIMFGMGLTLRWEDFRVVFSRPKDVLIGCLAQFTVMPLLAWVLARLFALDEALTVGVVLVGCCPGGTASNVITYLAKGDLALSVGMTGVSTLLAPVMTPLLVWLLAGKTVDVDVAAMFLSILWVVILPIVAGLVVKRVLPRLTERATAYLPALSSLAIAAIVLIVISASAHKLLSGGLVIVAVVMLHNIGGLTIGYLIASLLGLSWAKRKALSVEVGMQNSGLASSLATLHFAAYPMATIPGAVFSVWHNISGAIVARIYARKKNRMKDNSEERFPIVDEEGCVIGSATRGECHSGSKLLHPVVHLHVFNSRGEVYLQKRPEWKDIQPGKWDTSVGGHIDYGETPEQALVREVREELGITEFVPERVGQYVFESRREREFVYVHRTIYDGPVRPSAEELDGGRFWTLDEIRSAIGQNILTPNFESEFQKFFL